MIRFSTSLILLLSLFFIKAQQLPELPRMNNFNSCFPDTSGYSYKTVGPVGRDFSDLQTAINLVPLATVLVLDAGETFVGGFTLPEKQGQGWIIVISSRMDLLPKEGIRVKPLSSTLNTNFPNQKSAMPKIVTTNLAGIPCMTALNKAHHYRFVGIEFTADERVLQSFGLIHVGDITNKQNTVDKAPHHIIFDRCYIHGHSKGTIMKFGVRLDCAYGAVVDSDVSDFHSIGFDAQAIAGINGPGPFWILNNYLEASGENVFFGGGASGIPDNIPSDIVIRNNHFFKPLHWRVDHPTYAGKLWTIKNLFELKNGKRVLFDGNILENSWADLPIGQSGYAILLTVRTENGAAPNSDVSDITISNNIIRRCGAGISLSGSDDGVGIISKRIHIYNNLFEDISGPLYGDQNVNGPNDGTIIKLGEPQDVIIDHNTFLQTGPITWAGKKVPGFQYTNNLAFSFPNAAGYQGIYGPGVQHGNATIARYFPDITDASLRIHKNVFVGDNSMRYSNYNTISKNYFPASIINVRFLNYAQGKSDYHNYSLSDSSVYASLATEGKDIGCDFAKLDSALSNKRCDGVITGIQEYEKISTLNCFPNPVHDFLYVISSNSNVSKLPIFNSLGKVIRSIELIEGKSRIDVSDLRPGIYFITSEQGTTKFLKL
ncbi:MAG: T9SS type A sorting domain-containing protein [Saprospiraceae bacterium]|nr:T9SS type A sorting domain-containing protein [Saprospiraceae bacterium]